MAGQQQRRFSRRDTGDTYRITHRIWRTDQLNRLRWQAKKNGQFRNNSSKKELCEDWEKELEEEELLFSTAERNDEQKRIDTQTNYTKERKATVITKKS